MLRDGWNFHNDIAIPLENIARSILDGVQISVPVDKIYCADEIENGSFAELLIELVRIKTNYNSDREEITSFVRKCASLVGLNGHKIKSEVAQEFFDKFKELIGAE